MSGIQKTFLDYVEETTNRLEALQPQPEPQQEPIPEQSEESPERKPEQDFRPKQDMKKTYEVKEEFAKIWRSIHYHADFEQWLDIILSALERREDDYMNLIKGLDKNVLDAYAKMYGVLSAYFIEGYYGDPLGDFYQEYFSHGMGGEFYTPWNVAYMMAEMLDVEPDKTVCDPCCGSGIMFLAARCVIHRKYGWLVSSRYGRYMYGMDISSRAVKMAKINLYLTDYVYMICLLSEKVMEIKKKQEEAWAQNSTVKQSP